MDAPAEARTDDLTAPPSVDTSVDTSVEDHLARIADQGYTIIPDAIDVDLADALVETLERLERELDVRPAGNSFEGTRTYRIYNLLALDPIFQRVPVHPAVLPVVEGVLDPGCLVSSLSSIAIGPDEDPQPIHADDQLMPLPKPHVATVCNTMWALTEFTEANGATRLVPGSHLWDHSPDYGKPYDSIPAEMPRGSVLVWHGSLWHGGGANTTPQRRVGLAMNYCAGWIRQQENQQLGIPLDVLRRFGPRLRELCGFGIYRGLMGHIDRKDPSDVILGPVPETAPGSDGSADPGAPADMVWDAL
jgi:ectoine hydroxylase-related dioxygenase (phytanoyl-CoA dioxygenase family)